MRANRSFTDSVSLYPIVSVSKREVGFPLLGVDAFSYCQTLVDRKILQDVDTATDPTHLDTVDLVSVSQSEVQSRSVVALVTTATVNFVDEH